MSAEENLGSLTRTYRTNDRRRRDRALVLLVAGVVTTPATVGWFVAEKKRIDQSGEVATGPWAPALVAALAVLLLLLGAVFLVVFLCTRGEKFHLYEQGLVRETRNGLEVIWWGDIAEVGPIWGNSLIRWALGGESGCKIRLTEGQEVYITGFTEDAAELRRNIADRNPN